MDKEVTELIKGSLEKAEEKLRVARELLRSSAFDDALSRAYYSAFHATQGLLLTEGFSARTHHGVVNLFGLHFVKTGRFDHKFGKFLSELKDGRERSDYEIYSAIDREKAETAVKEADEFLKAIQKYLKQYL